MRTHLLATISLGALLLAGPRGSAQGTVFTYQGRALDNGTNFNGTGEFKFALVTSTNASSQATATANPPSGGFVTLIQVTYGGSGYAASPPPAVTLSGGGGSGAAATATVTAGAVTRITVSSPGSGYTSAPNGDDSPATRTDRVQNLLEQRRHQRQRQ